MFPVDWIWCIAHVATVDFIPMVDCGQQSLKPVLPPFPLCIFQNIFFIAILNFFLILPYTFRYFLILITRSHSFTNFITLYNTVSYCLILSHTCSYFLLVAHILSFFPTVHCLTIKSFWHCHATVLKPVQYRTPLLLWFRVQSS